MFSTASNGRIPDDQSSRYYGIGSTIIQHSGKFTLFRLRKGLRHTGPGFVYGDHIAGHHGESTEGLEPQTQVRKQTAGTAKAYGKHQDLPGPGS